MDEDVRKILKNVFFSNLSDDLQKEVEALARDLGYEKTITPKTNLSFLLQLYNTQRAKKSAARKLKEAEKMIMRIASLKYNEVIQKAKEAGSEKAAGFRVAQMASDLSLVISERIRQIFERLGIRDRKIIENAIWTLGEKEIENRAEIIWSSALDEKTIKGVFEFNPNLIIERFETLVATMEMLETKKEMIDAWEKENNRPSPLNYRDQPAVLFTDYAVLQKMLGEAAKEQPAEQETREEKTVEYRARPMRAEDLIKVLVKAYGCEVREGNHYIVSNPQNGKTTTISKSHKGQMELNRSVVKKIVEQQLGIDLRDFQKKREELGL